MNFALRNNFDNNAYRGNFPRPFPGNSSNNYGNSYGNSSYNNNRNPSDLENNIKEVTIQNIELVGSLNLSNHAQNLFNATIEETLNTIDDMSRSIDGISHDVENLKLIFLC